MATSKVEFPKSNEIVRVRMIDTTTVMTANAKLFVKPVQPGHEEINLVDMSFLVEHEPSGKKVLFDLGGRNDYWNVPIVLHGMFGKVLTGIKSDKDTTQILEEQGIDLKSITSVIWSHYHWDHTSDVSLFPRSTELVVGRGFKASPRLLPGYPEAPRSPVSASDFANRTLTEIDFESAPLTIGDFAAFDFFGDGSFYLLDTPGHCIGHMCGLARTTTNPDTFIFMGGDLCHFLGDFRPNSAYPIPDPIPDGVLDDPSLFPSPCPASVFTKHHPRTTDPQKARTMPWYEISDDEHGVYDDPSVARESVAKMQRFDESEHVLVCIAHDPSLTRKFPTLSESPKEDLNEWYKQGWKENSYWDWLNELPQDGKPGRKPIVDGFWRNGKKWDPTKDSQKDKDRKENSKDDQNSRL